MLAIGPVNPSMFCLASVTVIQGCTALIARMGLAKHSER